MHPGVHHIPVGDRGQRYEVLARDAFSNREFVVGWSDTEAGYAELVQMVEQHPSWHAPVVVDRWKGMDKEGQ